MSLAEHWDDRYRTVGSTKVSWFQESPDRSLHFIVDVLATPRDAAVIDIGGGASTLPDHLLDAGFQDITVVDISRSALDETAMRIGEQAEDIEWIHADVREWAAARTYGLWHDRAVYHFLTEVADQQRYWANVRDHLVPGGHVVMATFAEDGPTACSGLPTARYSADELLDATGEGFVLVATEREVHRTPSGGEQFFTWVVARRA
mgnify:FL=1